MQIDKAHFLFILNHATPELIKELDREFCGCGYVYHWFYMQMEGTWNPNQNELDYELRDVHTAEQLYDFLIAKTP